jgi:hypothetical protein
MAAGLGFKDFVTGEVLTAADVDGYLMQGIWVFASAAARDAAVTSPQEGNACYLKDTNEVLTYSGTAWVAVGGGTSPINPNLIINGNFTINQRAYVSAANLASGTYGFDRWKSNYTNTTLTYTSAPAGQSVTINSGGGLQQIVEQANMPAGTYTLSFSGTATGRIYNVGATPPSYAASPISFTADGSANVTVEFTASGSTKTLSKVKLEAGASATAFSYAGETIEGELANCQRYFNVVRSSEGSAYNGYGIGLIYSTNEPTFLQVHAVKMRTTPSLTASSTAGDFQFLIGSGVSAPTGVPTLQSGNQSQSVFSLAASGLTAGQAVLLRNNNTATTFIAFSAEL